jgi:hypothetical protein
LVFDRSTIPKDPRSISDRFPSFRFPFSPGNRSGDYRDRLSSILSSLDRCLRSKPLRRE